MDYDDSLSMLKPQGQTSTCDDDEPFLTSNQSTSVDLTFHVTHIIPGFAFFTKILKKLASRASGF